MLPMPQTRSGTRKLSEVARHLVLPSGIVSSGYPSVAAQCLKMGVVHDDWQQGLGRALLAKRATGLYAAGVGGVVLSTCRQVGKTFTFGTIIFALCILFPGLTVLWTAHHSRTSDETFDTLVGLSRRPKIAPFMLSPLSGNGKQSIRFRNGSRILFGAREHGFGRGIPGVAVVVFDEAQILKQSALNDMIPAANTVRNPLILYMGTPPDPTKKESSEVFTARRNSMLEIEKRRDADEFVESNTLYVEFGADEGADLDDRAQWAKGNPSFPDRTPAESMLRLREQLADDDAFSREGMGIWPADTAGSVVDAARWADCLDVRSKVSGAAKFVLDISPSRAWASIAVAGIRGDGLPHLEITSRDGVLDHRPGVEWVVPRAVELKESRPGFVLTVVSGSSTEPLIPALTSAGVDVDFVKAADLPAACGLFFDLVAATGLRHIGQSDLTDALVAARKNVADGEGAWRWGRRKSASDITPLYAATVALWALTHSPPVEPSVYFL